MGWDTQINIIVENIQNEEQDLAFELFQTDAKDYFHDGISYAKYRVADHGSKVLFFTYERRKYLPYWSIQEVSKKYPDKYFTIAASSPDFLCGPAGLVKIVNGDIIDSYGFFGMRQDILEIPDPEVLFQWFGKDRFEEQIRNLYIEKQSRKWIDERYSENLIEFTDEENKQLTEVVNVWKEQPGDWIEIKLK